jgi:hypothetical protein
LCPLPGIIKNEMKKRNSPYFVVTDPDIMLDNVKGDILEFYIFLLEKHKEIVAVGPMLRVDDIPDYYILKDTVRRIHVPQFWDRIPVSIEFKGKKCPYQISPIDTTFAMYRTKEGFKRWNADCIRTRNPYIAKHLDWYIDMENLTEDQKYYMEDYISHGGISHWGATWIKEKLKGKVL